MSKSLAIAGTTSTRFRYSVAFCILYLGSWIFAPQSVLAQRTLTVDIGTRADLDTIIGNLSNILLYAIEVLAVVLFIVGAFLFTISRGKEEGMASAGTGKSLMINSMIGLAIVLSAHAILRAVLYLLYS